MTFELKTTFLIYNNVAAVWPISGFSKNFTCSFERKFSTSRRKFAPLVQLLNISTQHQKRERKRDESRKGMRVSLCLFTSACWACQNHHHQPMCKRNIQHEYIRSRWAFSSSQALYTKESCTVSSFVHISIYLQLRVKIQRVWFPQRRRLQHLSHCRIYMNTWIYIVYLCPWDFELLGTGGFSSGVSLLHRRRVSSNCIQ